MDLSTRERVILRAEDRCEYCRMPQVATPLITFHVEHIVAVQHGGSDSLRNLALACDRCNAYKGPNLTTLSRSSKEIVPLFNPRENLWGDHFQIQDGRIAGKTAIVKQPFDY